MKIKEKPPIGVQPYYVFLPRRIKELTEAIERYNSDSRNEEAQLWIDELRFHNYALAKLMEFDKTLSKHKGKIFHPPESWGEEIPE